MERFFTAYTALCTWHKIQCARGYRNVRLCYNEEHVALQSGEAQLTWPLPPFQQFFDWVLNQRGVCLPHIHLEGEVPISYAVSFNDDKEEDGEEEDNEDGGQSCITDESSGDLCAPTIAVFAHSDKFDKEFNPAHGVSAKTRDNIGVSEMREVILKFEAFVARHRHARAVHLNLLVYHNVTSPSEKLLQQFFMRNSHPHQRLVPTIFSMHNDLQWFKLEHKLILTHHVMNEQEVETELRQDGIDVTQLPQIQTSDPVAQLMALRPGEVLRIKVPLDAVEDVVYRIVVESLNSASLDENVDPAEDEGANDEST